MGIKNLQISGGETHVTRHLNSTVGKHFYTSESSAKKRKVSKIMFYIVTSYSSSNTQSMQLISTDVWA